MFNNRAEHRSEMPRRNSPARPSTVVASPRRSSRVSVALGHPFQEAPARPLSFISSHGRPDAEPLGKAILNFLPLGGFQGDERKQDARRDKRAGGGRFHVVITGSS